MRELCATMGGTVGYGNRGGACFTVTLPAAPDTAPATPPATLETVPEPVLADPGWAPSDELVS